ncbi:MAG: phospholipase D family protein [Gammaproteobacteria bacterium]|nr:phospholipase D family protein [Gammaproteobacteria bacterium]
MGMRLQCMGLAGRALFLAALTALSVGAPAQAREPSGHFVLQESCGLPHPSQTAIILTGARAAVDFSPGGEGEALVLKAIGAARTSIRVQAHSFSDRRIQRALGAARARGVDVEVILDKTDTESFEQHKPVAAVIAAAGIPVWIDGSVRIAHNKVMIIDSADVITGSYNFTYAAAYDNAENLLYIRNAPALARAYLANWNWRRSCAQPYRGS